MLIKFLLVCGAPGGVLRQSEPLLLQEVFSFSFFDFVQTAEPEAGWVKKSSHVTLRRSVCFHRVGSNRQKHFNKCSGFFFSPEQIGLYLNIFLPAFIQTCSCITQISPLPENWAHPSWQALMDSLFWKRPVSQWPDQLTGGGNRPRKWTALWHHRRRAWGRWYCGC